MKPPLPICHLSCTLKLQHDHFDLLLPTFLLNPVSELHLLLVASDLPDHKFGTLCRITSNLLPLSPRTDPDSKLTSLLQLVNNWPPSELSAPLIRRHSRFCARYKCFFTLHYIKAISSRTIVYMHQKFRRRIGWKDTTAIKPNICCAFCYVAANSAGLPVS